VARPGVCARSAEASASFEKLGSTSRCKPVATPEVCAQAAGASVGSKSLAATCGNEAVASLEVCGRSAGASALLVFHRVAGALWKKYPVNNLMNALGTINLRYGDLDGNNEILTGTPVAPLGDGLVWNRSQTGFIAANNPEIYFYDHRADMNGSGDITNFDFNILETMLGSTSNTGDSLE
jgi:hypothetical protein